MAKPFRTRRAAHLRLGRRGEKIAVRLLREQGTEVLLRNYRCTQGEIDIVARDGEVLCFVEVKTRHRSAHSRPADAVGSAKKLRISRAAHRYLREIGWPAVRYRFDIVEVVLAGRSVTDVRHWRGAFTEDRHPAGARFPSVGG